MTTGISTSGVSTTNGPTTKELRKKYGCHKAPLLVSSRAVAYRRDMAFDEQFQSGPHKQTTHSWVVIDPELVVEREKEDGTKYTIRGLLVRANTYNGGLGEKVDYLNPASSGPIPGFARDEQGNAILDDNGQPVPTPTRKKALKGYSPIDIGMVPFVRVAADVESKQEEAAPPVSDPSGSVIE